MDIRYLGHSAFELIDGETRILMDPFLTGNPKAAAAADELEPTHILLTHGHADHYGDIVEIAKRTGAPVVAMAEIASELGELGIEDVHDPNLGGTVAFDWGWVKLVPAWHSSTTPNGTVNTPAGMLVMVGERLVYHMGDTALFSDIKLIAQRGNHVNVALVPIGGHYTMDRFDAVAACEWIGADEVIPIHYNTFPLIETDAKAFKSDVENATESKVVVLDPGQTHTVR
jgi:L-ascorbate metabolism protein UlaG (beta-lactamase superfamily)